MHGHLKAIDEEIKKLVTDYDHTARKLVAKIKKGRNEQLFSRYHILKATVRDKRAARTIEEDITGNINGMNHDKKRLEGILSTIREKKAAQTDLTVLEARAGGKTVQGS